MKATFKNLKVLGISSTVPKNSFDMTTLSDIYGKLEVDRIIKSTGIRSLRAATANTSSGDLCYQATVNLLSTLNIDPQSIDAIVFVSQTPDYIAPATSTILQHELGMSNNVVAFDINYGCSGYIYGLYQASLLISSGCQRVLICAGDVITPLLNESDRSVRMILGDAGSATIIEKGQTDLDIIIKTDGSGANSLIAKKTLPRSAQPEYLYMNGAKIMEFALQEVPVILDEILAMKKWNRDEVDIYALHQPNKFMLDYIAKKSRLPKQKVISAVEKYGNTGPASIPLVLSEHSASIKNSLDKVVMCGFGVGLSWGAIALSLRDVTILPVTEF